VRNRPLRESADAFFEAEADPDLRLLLQTLDNQLGGLGRYILMLPNSTQPRLDIQVQAIAAIGRARELLGLYNGDYALLEDIDPGSSRSLSVLIGGREATVGQLARATADHFQVPVRKLRFALPQSERLTWDELRGFVDWGTRRRVPLR
jgi:hypothetical protein